MGAETISDVNIEQLRAKYAHERERRIRPDGLKQYQSARGEFGYYAKDPYTERVERQPASDTVDALVIGAGFGGLLTGAFLRDAGLSSIRLMDEAGDVGGTWYWNRYPGIRCDIESHVYMPLLEELGYVPSERYATGEEIRQHTINIAKHYNLYQHALFHTRATGLTWDEESHHWYVETDRGDQFWARYVIVSSGTLTQPKLPAIPGIEDFQGHTFHTSRWDYGYTGGDPHGNLTGLSDKRVAVVGTGATGLQAVPKVAQDAEHLYVFQRTPSTVDVRNNHRTDPEWADSLKPGWQRKRMENFLAVMAGEPVDEDLVQDSWTATAQLQRQIISGAVDDRVSPQEREFRDEIADAHTMNRLRGRVAEVVEDPAVVDHLQPWYRYMCKRPGFSDEYLPAFNQPNVTLVDTADHGGITRMTEHSIFVGDEEYEVDCAIFATGFDVGVSGVLAGDLPVAGRGGQQLLAAWSHGPKTLHGFYSNGFPNLFHLGAVQNANSVNFVHILQEQAEHIAAVVSRAESLGKRVIEPTAQDQEDWTHTVFQTAHDNRDFQAKCTPGYYNGEGTREIVGFTYSPGPVAFHRLLRQWRETHIDDVIHAEEAPQERVESLSAGTADQ